MSEIRTLLERKQTELHTPAGSFERLVQRRDRKRRNQRIAAGVVGIAVFVAAVWIVTTVGSFDRTQTPAVPGGSETGPTETGPSVAPDPDAESINGLPPEGATPSTPESGELVVELANRVWVYADGRVISSVYDYSLEPYSGLVEQHLTPEGVEFLRSNVLATGLFEHDLELASRDNPNCCLDIRVRDGDRLVRRPLGPERRPVGSPSSDSDAGAGDGPPVARGAAHRPDVVARERMDGPADQGVRPNQLLVLLPVCRADSRPCPPAGTRRATFSAPGT